MKSLSQKAVANTMYHPLYVTEVIEMCLGFHFLKSFEKSVLKKIILFLK